MSQYAEAADLYALGLPQAALASGTDPTAALVAASGTADGYLRKRYTLPLTAWDEEITRRVCHLAAFDLLTTRGTRPGDALDLVTKRYDDAVKWFESVAKGLIEPSVTDSTPTFDEQHPVMGGGDNVFAVSDDGIWSDDA